MKDNTDSAVAEKKNDIGKFKSEQELLSAYNALEREFTKRCQLVKELQATLASREGAQAEVTEATAPTGTDSAHGGPAAPTAETSTQADRQAERAALDMKSASDADGDIKSFTEKRRADEAEGAALYAKTHAEEMSAIPEVMAACIEKYKRKIIAAGNVRSPEGMAVIVPAKRPKTLADAKLLADSMLDKF